MTRAGLLTSFALLLALPASAQQVQVSRNNKTIAVSTSNEASTVADTAVVSIGFQSFGKEQSGTYASAAALSNAIMAALTKAGVPQASIESVDQGLHTVEPGSDQDKARYADGLRFSFSQDWRVSVPADQAAKILQLAINAGANNSGSIDWRLKDDSALQAEAAAKALASARDIATSMAKGLNVSVGALLYASNQDPPRAFGTGAAMGVGMLRMADKAAALGPPLAITPQRITRSATVYAVFAIEP